jgi:hypothetical protein
MRLKTITDPFFNTRPYFFYLKQNVSETGFCLRLQVKPTQLGLIERDNLSLSGQQFVSGDRD